MKHRYDLYGFRDLDLEQACAFVESALGIRLQRRESSYRGVYYRSDGDQRKSFVLERDDTSTRFPDYRVRLSINDTAEMDAIRDKLTSGSGQAVLLDSETIDGSDDDQSDNGTREV